MPEDYSEMCDYEYLKKQIANVIANACLGDSEKIDEIKELVGYEEEDE